MTLAGFLYHMDHIFFSGEFPTLTDYAAHIVHDVIMTGEYKCFLREDTRLPMIYLPDYTKATIMALEAHPSVFHPEMR